jgi:hypothetical protein
MTAHRRHRRARKFLPGGVQGQPRYQTNHDAKELQTMSSSARKLTLCLVALFAASAVTASAASADVGQEFLHKGKGVVKRGFLGTGGETNLSYEGIWIACQNSKSKGEIAAAAKAKVTKLVVTFEKCQATTPQGSKCNVNTPGAPEGTMKTNPLTGELGEVKEAEATSGVGLGLESQNIVEFEAVCLFKTRLRGTVIGEIRPVGVEQLTSELVFAKDAFREQKIHSIELSEGDSVERDTLSANGVHTMVTGTNTIQFEEAVEVTKGE